MILQILLWALAVLLLANSILVTLRTKYNAGTTVLWVVSGIALVLALFFPLLGGFFTALWQTPAGQVLLIVALAGCAIYVGLMLFLGLAGLRGRAKGDERAFIVLGCGLRGEEVSDLLRRRLQKAVRLYRQNPAALIVVTGGQGQREVIPEAVAMRRWLLAQGVPPESILVEDESETTRQNLIYTQPLLIGRGIAPSDPVVVVTNTFHCYRAGWNARRCGYTSARTVPARMNATTFLQNYFREVLAMLKTWATGRDG